MVSATEHQGLLPSFSVEALRLPDRVCSGLRDLGLRSIAQLQALPRADLPSRFGPIILQRLDQAMGTVAESFEPERVPQPVKAEWSSEFGIRNRIELETVVHDLLGNIVAQLLKRHLGTIAVTVELQNESGNRTTHHISLLQPTQDAAHLYELTQLHLESLRASEPIVSVKIDCTIVILPVARQQTLFDEDRDADAEQEFSRLIDRLSSRLGEDSVTRPEIKPDPQPENAAGFRPMLRDSTTSQAERAVEPSSVLPLDRPIAMLPKPVQIEVHTDTAGRPDLLQLKKCAVRCPFPLDNNRGEHRHLATNRFQCVRGRRNCGLHEPCF